MAAQNNQNNQNNPSGSNKGLDEIIKLIVDNRLATVYTSLMSKVLAFYPETMRADVQPLLKTLDINGIEQDSSATTNVPVIFPNSGDFYIRTPLVPGDLVLVQYSTVALDYILESDRPVNPTIKRRFSQKDGMVLGGYRYDGGEKTLSGSSKDMIIHRRSTDTIIKFTESGNIEISGAKTVSAQCEKALIDSSDTLIKSKQVTIDAPLTTFKGQVVVEQTLTGGAIKSKAGKDLDNHTHKYRPGDGAPTDTSAPS